MPNRKPQPTKEPTPVTTKSRPSAQQILDKFMKENDIVFALGRPTIDFTNTNTMIVNPPKIMVAYRSEINAQSTN